MDHAHTIDGKPFTSYIWPTTLKKPVLHPLRAASGTVVRAPIRSIHARVNGSIIQEGS
jgi:hypothetical protein